MISIIIPTLNEESVIERTLLLLKKNFSIPHEIIVSDGRSTDRTVEIAKKYADRVVEYAGIKRQTIAQGRNDGAKIATGEFLVFMDADCTILDLDSFFKRALQDFREKNLVGLGAWIRVLPDYETFADKIIFSMDNRTQWFFSNVLKIAVARGEFQMIRRSTFIEAGGYNQNLVATEDMDMFKRLSKIGKTYVDHKLVLYHTGRRAHKIGWPKLLSLWGLNFLWAIFFRHSYVKVWEEVR